MSPLVTLLISLSLMPVPPGEVRLAECPSVPKSSCYYPTENITYWAPGHPRGVLYHEFGHAFARMYMPPRFWGDEAFAEWYARCSVRLTWRCSAVAQYAHRRGALSGGFVRAAGLRLLAKRG